MEEKRIVRRLMEEIERVKERLVAMIGRTPDLSDPKVLEASRKLDGLMNEYYRLLGSKGRSGTR